MPFASRLRGEIVRDTKRLNLTQSDSALAEAKLREAKETTKTRLRESWCYLLYPVQETAQAEVTWMSGKVPAQDGLLSHTSKKLVSEEGLLPELGPTRLDRDLQKYIWNGKHHLLLKDLWEYLNRYTYLPRLKDRNVLIKAIQAAVSGIVPGPFGYAEGWDEATASYRGLVIDKNQNALSQSTLRASLSSRTLQRSIVQHLRTDNAQFSFSELRDDRRSPRRGACCRWPERLKPDGRAVAYPIYRCSHDFCGPARTRNPSNR